MKSSDKIFILCTMLSLALAYLSTDIYLPALPAIKLHLNTSVAQTQHTLTVYLFGLALSQIITGPIIDHYGYRRMLMPALFGFIFVSFACAVADNIDTLLIARSAQGFLAGSIGVAARASYNKRFSAEQTQSIFMKYGPALILSSVIAPTIGGLIVHLTSWQGVFVFLALFGLAISLGLYKHFHINEPETSLHTLKISSILGHYYEVLTHKAFFQYLLVNGMYLAIVFSYAAEAPFIFHLHGHNERAIGLSFIPMSLAFLLASQLNLALNKKISIRKIINMAYALVITGLIVMALPITHSYKVATMIGGITLATFGMGFSSPLAFSKALTMIPHRSGYASSVLMAVPFITSTLLTMIVHPFCGNNIDRLAGFLAVIATACVGGYHILHKLNRKATTVKTH